MAEQLQPRTRAPLHTLCRGQTPPSQTHFLHFSTSAGHERGIEIAGLCSVMVRAASRLHNCTRQRGLRMRKSRHQLSRRGACETVSCVTLVLLSLSFSVNVTCRALCSSPQAEVVFQPWKMPVPQHTPGRADLPPEGGNWQDLRVPGVDTVSSCTEGQHRGHRGHRTRHSRHAPALGFLLLC